MKITTWNVRGLSAPNKRCLVKRAFCRCSCDIIAIQETKLSSNDASCFIKSCRVWEGVFQEANGAASGLGILLNHSLVKVTLLEKVEHWMICIVYSMKENLEFPLINVYGPTKTIDKSHVWNVLSNKIYDLGSDRIVVVGNFNALLDLDEKKGGLRMSNKVMEDICDFVA